MNFAKTIAFRLLLLWVGDEFYDSQSNKLVRSTA